MEKENLYPKASDVIELTSKNIKNGRITHPDFQKNGGIVVFYAPWCGHCQRMRQMWIELALQFKNQFAVGAVNCEKNGKICVREDIQAYPTIKYQLPTRKGKMLEYYGGMEKDDFIYFICSKI